MMDVFSCGLSRHDCMVSDVCVRGESKRPLISHLTHSISIFCITDIAHICCTDHFINTFIHADRRTCMEQDQWAALTSGSHIPRMTELCHDRHVWSEWCTSNLVDRTSLPRQIYRIHTLYRYKNKIPDLWHKRGQTDIHFNPGHLIMESCDVLLSDIGAKWLTAWYEVIIDSFKRLRSCGSVYL